MFNFLKDIIKPSIQASNTAPNTSSIPAVAAGPFQFMVEDVFTIKGRGSVATGKVQTGAILLGQMVQIKNPDGSLTQTQITGIEAFRKQLKTANTGESVGLLFKDLGSQAVVKGALVSPA